MLEIINLKSFSDLTEAEKHEFRELFSSEEEFEALKQFYENFEGYKKNQKFSTHYMTKGSLDELFASEHPKRGIVKRLFPPHKPVYLNPVLQIAALVLVILLVYNLKEEEINKPQLATVTKTQFKRQVEKQVQKTENKETELRNTFQNETKSNFTEDHSTKKNAVLIAHNSSEAMESESDSEAENKGTISKTNFKDEYFSSSYAYASATEANSGLNVQSDDTSFKKNYDKSLERKSSQKSVNNQKDLLDLLTPVYK